MSQKDIIIQWVDCFNRGDVDGLMKLYHPDAVNHQVAMEPMNGQEAIRKMFQSEFGRAEMVCIIENLFEDGQWLILEWKDPLGLRGCGFFQIESGKIKFQRGYFDMLSFLRQQNLPLPTK